MNTRVLRARLDSLWKLIRQLATDDAYERYLARHCDLHPGEAPLTRRAFYVREQQHKWNGIKRCC
jgi:uncharacterized short protein YbdD (DUF466 family)